MYLEAESKILSNTVTSCEGLITAVAAISGDNTLGYDELDLEKMAFAQQLSQATNGQLSSTNGTLHVNVTSTSRYTYRHVDVPAAEWQANPVLSVNPRSFPIVGSCFVPEEVRAFSAELVVKTAEPLMDWRSATAKSNQIGYDTETGLLKAIYGYDGLGFGEYAKGGIWLFYPRFVTGYYFNMAEFSLHWQVQAKDITRLAAEIIPAVIDTHLLHDWSSSCQGITLRFASNVGFENPSLTIGNDSANCDVSPVFSLEMVDSFPAQDSTDFTEYLTNADKLNLTMVARDASGHPVDCESRDPMSLDGCSQPIVLSIEPILRGYMKGEHDLFVDVNFNDFMVKTYQVNAGNGVMTEISSVYIGQ